MLDVVDLAMFTPLGNTEQTIAATQAGLNVYQECSLLNRKKNRLKTCFIPNAAIVNREYDSGKLKLHPRQKRILDIAGTALDALFSNTNCSSLPLLLAAPEKLPNNRTPIDDRYLNLLLNQFSAQIDSENSFIFPHGRAAIFSALESANDLLNSGEHETVIVGCVDSFRDVALLMSLEQEERVLASNVIDGFAPAEAATFFILRKNATKSLGVIQSWGAGIESGHRYSDDPYTGTGLATAVKNACAEVELGGIGSIYANLNGEGYFSKEWGVAQIRNAKYFNGNTDIHHPADCFGDVGAAWGGVMLALALTTNTGPLKSLICCSSELDYRAAIVLKERLES